MQCKYKNRHRIQCEEDVAEGSEYCVLHMPLPASDKSVEFKRINELKNKKIEEKTKKQDYNFQGAKLHKIDLSGKVVHEPLIFEEAEISESAIFKGARLHNLVLFSDAKIGKTISFENTALKLGGDFIDIEIGQSVNFTNSIAGSGLDFLGAQISNSVYFNKAKIDGYIRFDKAKIGFKFSINGTDIKGELSFKHTQFGYVNDQESACRRAKSIYEQMGNRDAADYHFYREMEAKRLQKKLIWQILEFPIQHIFGYGIRPYNVLGTWFAVVLGFGFASWIFKGVVNANTMKPALCFWENIYFSIVTATTLGYGDYQPKPGFFQMAASFVAIFGTFMWAAFIVIFARKFMR